MFQCRGFFLLLITLACFSVPHLSVAQGHQISLNAPSAEMHQNNKTVIFNYFSNLLALETTAELNLFESALLADSLSEKTKKKIDTNLTTSEVKFITEAIIMSAVGWSVSQIFYITAQLIAENIPHHLLVDFTPKEQILLRDPAPLWMYVSSNVRGQMPHIDSLLEKIDYMVTSPEQVVIDYPPVWVSPVLAGDISTVNVNRVTLDFDQFHRLIRKAIILPAPEGARFIHRILNTTASRESLMEMKPDFEKIADHHIRAQGTEIYLPSTFKNRYATFFRAHQRIIKYSTNAVFISAALAYYFFHTPHETRADFLTPQNFFIFFNECKDHLLSEDFSQLNTIMDEQPQLTQLLARYLKTIPEEIKTYQKVINQLSK